MIYIARILYPVKVLGPGNRIGIWFDGCSHGCKGCSNPELWEFDDRYKIEIDALKDILNKLSSEYIVDGITITGGDPFFQPDALKNILPSIRNISEDILVYTGFEYEEISEKYSDILEDISVLIDGKYIEEKNTGLMLRGSENQRIIYIDKDIEEKYKKYLSSNQSQIQNFESRDGIISVGIHKPGYNKKLKEMMEKKGVICDE